MSYRKARGARSDREKTQSRCRLHLRNGGQDLTKPPTRPPGERLGEDLSGPKDRETSVRVAGGGGEKGETGKGQKVVEGLEWEGWGQLQTDTDYVGSETTHG